jgi:hypothetical protein
MMAGIIDDSNPWFTAEEYPADPDYAAKEAAAELKAAADPNWPKIDATAYYGLAGEIVSVMAPQTEADQVALLMQFLVYAGNAIGRGPYYLVNKDRHYANLYLLIAGISSRARKGLSAGLIRVLMELADPGWTRNCLTGGLSSGEGVLHAIRDPVYGMRGGEWTLIDPGVADKRLMLDEREFYSALTVMRREGNIVSRIIRDAWDCLPTLRTLTKTSPSKVTNAFISIVGHITSAELAATLDSISMANGYANRFLFACVRRTKLMPFGVPSPVTSPKMCFAEASQNAHTASAASRCARLILSPPSISAVISANRTTCPSARAVIAANSPGRSAARPA